VCFCQTVDRVNDLTQLGNRIIIIIVVVIILTIVANIAIVPIGVTVKEICTLTTTTIGTRFLQREFHTQCTTVARVDVVIGIEPSPTDTHIRHTHRTGLDLTADLTDSHIRTREGRTWQSVDIIDSHIRTREGSTWQSVDIIDSHIRTREGSTWQRQ